VSLKYPQAKIKEISYQDAPLQTSIASDKPPAEHERIIFMSSSKQFLLTAAAFTLATVPGLTTLAHAGDSHLFEVGSGMESAVSEGGVNVLLKIGYGYSRTPDETDPDPVLGPEQLVWAHISGDMAFDPSATGAAALPMLDIRIIPVHNSLSVILESGNAIYADLQLLPMTVGRDIRIDQNASVKVSVVGLQVGFVNYRTEQVALYAQVAADAIGYKMVDMLSDAGTFHGGRVLGTALEGGAHFTISENFTIRIALGGSVDLNLGSVPTGFAVQSDLDAYLAVRADIARFIQIFLKGGINANCLSANSYGCDAAPQLMLGATFLF
jgi:hypothetical protein